MATTRDHPDPCGRRGARGGFEYLTCKKDELVGWARKFSLFPYPFVTACCAMEFMAVSSTPYDTDRSAPRSRASRRASRTC
jgi:NADH-quinone oxidoreductase subunit B